MDIAICGKTSLKLKGKRVTFIIDPSLSLPKTEAHAIILLNGEGDIDTSRITDSRITINGAGGYEVGGSKISAATTPNGIIYKLLIDGISIILGRSTDATIEGFNECSVAIVNAENDFNESFVTAVEPKIAVLYGEKKIESAKTLGAESVTLVSKVTITKDKLPEKMEVVVLG